MRIGQRDRYITLQHRTLARNGGGENIATFTEYDRVWASKRDLRGTEFFTSQQVNAETQATWNIRFRTDVVVTDRLVDDTGAVFEITHLAEVGRRKELDLVCRAIPNG